MTSGLAQFCNALGDSGEGPSSRSMQLPRTAGATLVLGVDREEGGLGLVGGREQGWAATQVEWKVSGLFRRAGFHHW